MSFGSRRVANFYSFKKVTSRPLILIIISQKHDLTYLPDKGLSFGVTTIIELLNFSPSIIMTMVMLIKMAIIILIYKCVIIILPDVYFHLKIVEKSFFS